MIQNEKMKMIGTIALGTIATLSIVGLSLLDRKSNFVGIANRNDSVIAFNVTDSSFVKDSMLFLQKKKGQDTILALAQIANSEILANDSTVISIDTLTNIRVVRRQ